MSHTRPRPGDALAFLDYVRGECAATGVKLRLLATDSQPGDVAGVFDDAKKTLTVCVHNDDWLILLAHELSHLHQWRYKSRAWTGINEAVDGVFDPWLAGKDGFTDRQLDKAVRVILRCELDAERRTARLIKRFRLGDLSEHARRANAYLWSYPEARKRREFRVPDSAQMPGTLTKTPHVVDPDLVYLWCLP